MKFDPDSFSNHPLYTFKQRKEDNMSPTTDDVDKANEQRELADALGKLERSNTNKLENCLILIFILICLLEVSLWLVNNWDFLFRW